MVQVLASRAAGYRLGLVVFSLLIPVIYLGYMITADLLQNYALARSNGAAVELVDLTFRTMVDQASGWSVSDQQKRLLGDGPLLAKKADVVDEYDLLRGKVVNENSSKRSKLVAAHDLLMAISDGPLMNDVGNREANALATAGAMLLPSILLTDVKIQDLADESMHSQTTAAQNMDLIVTLCAELDVRSHEFKSALEHATANSRSPGQYAALQSKATKMMEFADQFRAIQFDDKLDPLAKMQKTAGALRNANLVLMGDLSATWEELSVRLLAISKARLSQIMSSISRNIGGALLAVVLGLGMAIRMFNSTLKKLDEVEIAKAEADKARFMAESSVTEIAAVNNNLADMNKEVSHHLKALEEAQEQLVKKGRMEQMGQLTATMAHELRNPLGAARTSIFLLERKTRGKGLGVESQIQRITNAIMRCDDIITQLLDFSRTKKLSPTSADFDAWLEKIITDEALRLPQALSISVELGTSGTPIAFDPSRMQRAITNLLNNASEAMVGTGDDSTKFSVPNPRIDIRSSVVNGQLELTVADNGPGISAENLARVREPLFTTKSFGTGLGLPAVEQIAAQHGGSMRIASEVGRGTTATILLPLEAVHEAA